MSDSSRLHVVMYHYVREFRRTRFPDIKGMEVQDFRDQVSRLSKRFEMATVESSMAFLEGSYRPGRDMCLLTFDDGLREHFETVTPILEQEHIQGVFFLVTSCLEDSRVASVHMNHFLTAGLGFEEYRRRVVERLRQTAPQWLAALEEGHELESATYPWDTAEAARFKYFFNFVMDAGLRDELVSTLFSEAFGSTESFARELYVNWEEARTMQRAGMAMGGHTHRHRPLAALSDAERDADLSHCRSLLESRLGPQQTWSFSYPYGKKTSFNQAATDQIKKLGFDCAFSTETGSNPPGSDVFQLRRMDCKNAPA